MAKAKTKQTDSEQNRIDEVGKSGVYPVSEMEKAGKDAKVHGEASWGQDGRGAEGYEDSGSSELFYLDEELEGLKEKDDKQS